MSEENKTSAENIDPETEKKPDPVRIISKYVLYLVIFLFTWYVIADRIAPWTDQARVQAYVVPVVSQVSGRVIEINVNKDQRVQPGEVLFKIDPADYKLAVESAESELELAGQEIGAGTATVTTAQAGVVEAETNLNHMKVQSVRVYELEKQNVFSKSDGDKARAKVKSAEAQLMSAHAQLEKAKQSLGKKGNENPRIRSAIAALKKAQLDLSRTTLVAPSLGGITNLQIDVGQYATAGKPQMTFIEIDNIWIQANLRENNLANIKPGNSVDIALDVAPGKIFKGTVSSVGFAVDSGNTNTVGGLASVKGKSGWLRDAQRFPVIITFDDNSAKGYRRLGGQADVLIYTSNNWVINPLGWIWIRVLSWFSYVY
ncbi:Probable Co/Zn/Cd efflux system membrane fusion protein [hydrothermal vent metagenome]|uniref:Probable Co/Zn/Cd efflux system membrane fusion protein n=1 Tax=hydrothermal vent metagenome TaxID=652676 RepID=A0A3B0XRZ0_9ZZZZ